MYFLFTNPQEKCFINFHSLKPAVQLFKAFMR